MLTRRPIILEGLDASGKSTLAARLASWSNAPIISSEGPEKEPGEINRRIERYLDIPAPVIFDRHPAISNEIYRQMPEATAGPASEQLIEEVRSQDPVIIFCQSADWLNHHPRDEVDSKTHLSAVEKNWVELSGAYAAWAWDNAHLRYRIGDDMDNVCRAAIAMAGWSFDPIHDMSLFHIRFGLSYYGPPRRLEDDVANFRTGFMFEELHEYQMASERLKDHLREDHPDNNRTKKLLADQLDALVDLTYVALGTSYLHGFDFAEAWRRVHEANMKKVRVEKASQSKRGSRFDVVKPERWEPPSHLDLMDPNLHQE